MRTYNIFAPLALLPSGRLRRRLIYLYYVCAIDARELPHRLARHFSMTARARLH